MAGPLLERTDSPRRLFQAARQAPEQLRGDLLGFIRLGPKLQRFGPPADTIAPVRAVSSGEAAPGLFDDVVIPVVLVGTSYSAGPLWSFEDALKVALQTDVVNAAEQGPFAPMGELLDSGALEDVKADLVIWEIPERYFHGPGRPVG